MHIQPIENIEQAVQYIQALPSQKQKSVFDYIGFLMLEYQKNDTPKTVIDVINQYPTPTSFNADDVVKMQRQWRDEWE